MAERKPLARATYASQAKAWSDQVKTQEELIVTNHLKGELPQGTQVVNSSEI